jgi:hypothetical protein
MQTWYALLLGIVLVISIAIFAHRYAPTEMQVAAAAESTCSFTLREGYDRNTLMRFSGTAQMDTSTGLPAVPYIWYRDECGRTWSKQLIYANMRGCAAGAPDMPCVPGYPQTRAYPQLETGQTITAEGYVHEHRLIVTSLEVED